MLLNNDMIEVIRTLIKSNAILKSDDGKEKYLKISDFIPFMISKKPK